MTYLLAEILIMEDQQFTTFQDMNKAYNFELMKEFLAGSDLHYAICVDNSGNYTFVNKKYAENFGHLGTNFIGKSYADFVHPDDVELFGEISGKCYAFPGELFPAAIRMKNGNGGFSITQWDFSLVTENGFPNGVFCFGSDVAEYEQVKTRFFLVDSELEVKKEILGAIAYEQSHRVRGPLANISGLINVLKHYDLAPEVEVIVNMLQESTTIMDEIIKSFVKKSGQ